MENFQAQINHLAQTKRAQYENNPHSIVDSMKQSLIQSDSRPNDSSYEESITNTVASPQPSLTREYVHEIVQQNMPEHISLSTLKIDTKEFKNLEQYVRNNYAQLSTTEEGAQKIYNVFKAHISEQWGEQDSKTTSQTVFVKYTNHYKSRASIDFEKGFIVVETLDTTNPKEALKQAIVLTLLTPDNPDGIDITNDNAIKLGERPYLANYVRDHEGKEVLYEWRANRYAEYLIDNNLQKIAHHDKELWRVEFQMQSNYSRIQYGQYDNIIRHYAELNNLDPALVLGIIKTESSFNPYATSSAPAYGLMQVVPSTAGADAFEKIYNRKGKPTAKMLYHPKTNIEFGTTYLHILRSRYLMGVTNPQSLEYCMIVAYNAGAGTVLQTFHSDRQKAIHVINQKTPQEVYSILHTQLSSEQGRRYLQKVTTAKKDFQVAH